MKFTKHILTTVIILINLISFSQEESLIKDINEKFKTINQTRSYQKTILQNEEFMEHVPDFGGELTGFHKNDTVYKIHEKIGLSYGLISTEYYYWNEKPILIYFIEDSFEQIIDSVHGFTGWNHKELVRQLEARYYYYNDSLIDVKRKGESLLGEEYEIEMRARLFNNALKDMKIVKQKIK